MLAKRVYNACTWVLIVAVALLAVALVGVRVAGYTPYAILSGSMTPTYEVGSLVYVKAVPAEQIEVGDAITFVNDSALTVVTHRVVAIDEDARTFTTQGDANTMADAAPVAWENLVGRVDFSVPRLGVVANFISTTSGKFAAAAALFALLLLLLLPELFKKEAA